MASQRSPARTLVNKPLDFGMNLHRRLHQFIDTHGCIWLLKVGLPCCCKQSLAASSLECAFPKDGTHFSGCREQPCNIIPCFDWSQLHKSKYSLLAGSQQAPRIPIQSEPHRLLQLPSTTCFVRAALHDFLLPSLFLVPCAILARRFAIAHAALCSLGIICFDFWAGFEKAANQAQNKSRTVRGWERRARFQRSPTTGRKVRSIQHRASAFATATKTTGAVNNTHERHVVHFANANGRWEPLYVYGKKDIC